VVGGAIALAIQVGSVSMDGRDKPGHDDVVGDGPEDLEGLTA
jgi:hypothetical protein